MNISIIDDQLRKHHSFASNPTIALRPAPNKELPMCGIVGAVSTRNIVPDPHRGPEAARIPRLRLLRRRGAPGRRAAPRAQHRARGRARSQRRRPTHVQARHRHRAHALGHARRAGGAQRAPALLAGRPPAAEAATSPAGRRRGARIALVHNGIIENHDELRAELEAQRLRVREPDRHRGHRAPGRPPVRRRPVRRRAARRCRACAAPTRSPCSAATSRTA